MKNEHENNKSKEEDNDQIELIVSITTQSFHYWCEMWEEKEISAKTYHLFKFSYIESIQFDRCVSWIHAQFKTNDLIYSSMNFISKLLGKLDLIIIYWHCLQITIYINNIMCTIWWMVRNFKFLEQFYLMTTQYSTTCFKIHVQLATDNCMKYNTKTNPKKSLDWMRINI